MFSKLMFNLVKLSWHGQAGVFVFVLWEVCA